jgi:hypothetical protein
MIHRRCFLFLFRCEASSDHPSVGLLFLSAKCQIAFPALGECRDDNNILLNIILCHVAVLVYIATKSDGFDFVPHFMLDIRVGTEAVVVKKNLIET